VITQNVPHGLYDFSSLEFHVLLSNGSPEIFAEFARRCDVLCGVKEDYKLLVERSLSKEKKKEQRNVFTDPFKPRVKRSLL